MLVEEGSRGQPAHLPVVEAYWHASCCWTQAGSSKPWKLLLLQLDEAADRQRTSLANVAPQVHARWVSVLPVS